MGILVIPTLVLELQSMVETRVMQRSKRSFVGHKRILVIPQFFKGESQGNDNGL